MSGFVVGLTSVVGLCSVVGLGAVVGLFSVVGLASVVGFGAVVGLTSVVGLGAVVGLISVVGFGAVVGFTGGAVFGGLLDSGACVLITWPPPLPLVLGFDPAGAAAARAAKMTMALRNFMVAIEYDDFEGET